MVDLERLKSRAARPFTNRCAGLVKGLDTRDYGKSGSTLLNQLACTHMEQINK